MADWVTGKVTKVQNWTDALFSLTVHAPVLPFTAGQFTKLGLEIDGERVQRAYSYVNQAMKCRWLAKQLASLFWMKYRTAKRYGCWQPVQRLALIYRFCN